MEIKVALRDIHGEPVMVEAVTQLPQACALVTRGLCQ